MRTFKKSFTIVIPNHNGADFLWECLESVANQTEAPDEVIIIDDKSNDESLVIANEFKAKIENLKIIQNTTQVGTMGVLNNGLRLANSEYVIFLSSNDILLPKIIELYKKASKKFTIEPGLISSMAYMSVIDDDIQRARLYPSPVVRLRASYLSPVECVSKLDKVGSWFMGITIAYNRKNLMDFGAFEIFYGGLADMYAAFLISSTYGAYFFPRPLACMRSHKGGLLSKTLLDKSFMEKLPETIRKVESLKSPSLYGDEFINKCISRVNFSAIRESIKLSKRSKVLKMILVFYYFLRFRPWDIFPSIFNRLLGSRLIIFLIRFNLIDNL
jgi:glycosyltransferase involved in cell wall biosynthesis